MAEITVVENGGCHEVWYRIDGTDPNDADYTLCIAATEIAEGGTRESAVSQARADLLDAIAQLDAL